MGAIIDLLNAGRYAQAAPMLQGLLQANPRDHDALYNLGMVYSDQGRLDDAMELLHRAVKVNPEHANSWVALGVAALRLNDPTAARPALEHAVNLDSTNPFALRTLATLHSMVGEDQHAMSLLRSAIAIAPDDAIALLTLAQALLRQSTENNAAEADTVLTHILELVPHGEIAGKAKEARRKIGP
jgi:tetratricopeptide (TPR) repeat protein